MTSRRPMTRSFSGNGRSSSINAEDEMSFSNGRSESRNPYLSNVRPENSYSSQRYTGSHYRSSRSTLCSVMAQLTDDIQPTFDITLKSKAVSEACNVKFTCVVSGYPVPELTWYKDDMEMDRYCGLPKYEIGRNGKTHTLHIYNCTVDDAAIYQASACNSKGIVSCSGVLEVGTMSEYKIHQRFFANLKQKADKKKRELEDSRRRGKENVRSSPDRTQRKRRSPEEVEPPTAPRVPQEESQVADVVERPAAVSFEANGVSAEACKKDVSQSLDLEVETKNSAIETLAKKKSKVSNGIDSGTFSSNHTVQGNGGENSYDGGLSFSQFLAGALHSQVAEEKQNLARLEKTVQVDDSSADVDMEKESAVEKEKQEKERALAEEQERRRIKERDLEMEKQREKERECARQREMLQRTTQETPSRAKTETKAHKQSDHHNIQASLTSVLHSVKDFFFGKSKKGHSRDEESSEEKERDFPVAPKQPYPSPPPHRPQELFVKPEVYEPPKEEAVPLEVNESQKASRIVRSDTQPLSLEPLTPDGYNHMMISPHTEDEPTTFKIALEDMSGSEEKNIVDMCLEVGGERPQNLSLSVLQSSIEVVNTNYQTVPVTEVVVPNPHEVNSPVMSPELDPQMERGETLAAPKQDLCEYTPSPESTQESGWHMSNLTTVALSGSLTECSVFITDSHGTIETDSHGTNKTDSHGTIETDSHGTIKTDSHGTIETDSHGTIETDSHGTIETDSHGTIETDSHETIETDSHGTIETDSHGTIKTDSHGTIETDSHETIETDSHGTIETDSHETIETDSHGTIETDSHETIETNSHGTIETDSHGTIKTDSHGTIETDSHGTIETDSHETIETDSHGTIETDSHGTIETDSHGTIETDSHETIETDSHGTIETDSHGTIETDSHGTIETDSHGTIETDSHETIEIDKAQEIHVDVNNIVSDYEIRENHSQSTQNEGENFMEEIQPWPHVEDNIQTIDSETPALIDRAPVVESIEPEQLPLILGENMLIKSQTNESIIVSQNYPEETPVFKECAGNGDYNFIEDAAPVLRESEEETILKAETQEPMVPETEEKASELDVKNVNIQGMYEILAFKNEKTVESEELEGQTTLDVQYKSSNHLETQSERDYVSMHEEISLSSSVIRPGDNTSHLGALTENVPDIRIFDSVIEDLSDFKQNENIAVTPIEIVKSEVGEPVPSKPLSVTELESEHDICQSKEERDASEKAVKTTATLSVSPTEEGMQDNNRFPAAKNIEEVMQQDETTLMGKKPNNLHNASLSVMNQWIPTINISCTDGFSVTDDDHDSLAKPSAFDGTLPYEAPKSPLFVVPPISVSVCEDSPGEAKLPPTFENTECLSLVEMLRGIESSLEKITTVDTDKLVGGQKQDTETEKERNDIPSVYNETAEVVSITPSLSKALDSVSVTALDKIKPNRETKTEPEIDRLGFKNPTPPLMSPASMRRFLARAAPTTDSPGEVSIPAITVGDSTQSDKTGEELSGGSTPTSSLSCESSPRLKRRDSLSQIRSATPEELASGARRKIFIPKTQGVEGESAVLGPGVLDVQCKKETPYMSPSQARRAAFLQASTGSQTPPLEKRSPLLARRKTTLDVPRVLEESTVELENPANETKPVEKEKPDPFKAPQVIRKIRGELFTDVSGHLKLWCQFFNVLSDSTIKWYRDEEEIVEVQRSGGDESQVALAIVQASSRDCGVYGCTIKNEYGTDSTDFLLSVDILSELLLRDETEVGEEIEMTPLTFSRGLVDSGHWGDKFFGRIMTEEAHLGEGCKHKASRVKVIYGLDPVFESGSTCIIKVQNPIAYGTKEESNLMERNLEITKQECRIQNMVREYCKIFAAEARVIENFGFALEVIPQYLMYRPANSVPYATVEADINGVYLRYCLMDAKGRLIMRTISEVEQKCCTFQHWIHQWTHGNLLVTRLEGVEMKITNVRVATKSKGYQGLTDIGSPNIFEQFLTLHQCNYYCGLLSLRSLKVTDSLQQPPKIKSSRSPLLNRKLGQNSSPQTQRKGLGSPQLVKKSTSSPKTVRKTNSSPKVVRKTEETEDKSKTVEVSKDVTIR